MNVPPRLFVIDDDQLIASARAGDSAAFGELVRRYQMDVRSLLRRKLGDSTQADDLAQEVFIGALTAIQRFKQQSTFKSWLLSIARHKLIDFLRSSTSRREAAGVEWYLDNESLRRAEAETEFSNDDLILTLKNCLAMLQPQAKQLVQQYYFEQLPAHEIANRASQKPGTVRMTLMRIRQSLKKCIKKRLGDSLQL